LRQGLGAQRLLRTEDKEADIRVAHILDLSDVVHSGFKVTDERWIGSTRIISKRECTCPKAAAAATGFKLWASAKLTFSDASVSIARRAKPVLIGMVIPDRIPNSAASP
jgi:hypothetical protein